MDESGSHLEKSSGIISKRILGYFKSSVDDLGPCVLLQGSDHVQGVLPNNNLELEAIQQISDARCCIGGFFFWWVGNGVLTNTL